MNSPTALFPTPAGTATAPTAADDTTYRQIAWRLIPILFACYVFNYLDGTNIGYAQLQMKTDLGFSDAVFGLGAGIFFIGYALFEIPSYMLLARVGRRTCSRSFCSRVGVQSG